MKKSILEFNENGTGCVIKFKNGKESTEMTSKKEAFQAVTDLAQVEKLSVEEFSEMRDQILHAENLAWDENMPEINILIGMHHGFAGVFGGLFGGGLFSQRTPMEDLTDLADMMGGTDESVEEPTFRICPGCGKHAKILLKGGWKTSSFFSKSEGLQYLNLLKKENISEAEYDRLLKEISECALPEG